MKKTDVKTVEEYLESVPEPRRGDLETVRNTVLRNLPKGYVETVAWGMICYEIPLADYPDTYNKKPLMFAALSAQKNHLSLHLMCTYGDEEREAELRTAFAEAGKKLDMGKSCIRFRTAGDLDLTAIGRMIKATPPKRFIAKYEASRKR